MRRKRQWNGNSRGRYARTARKKSGKPSQKPAQTYPRGESIKWNTHTTGLLCRERRKCLRKARNAGCPDWDDGTAWPGKIYYSVGADRSTRQIGVRTAAVLHRMPGGARVPGTTQTEPHELGSCRAATRAYETRLKRCTREGQADSCSCSCDSEGGGKVSCDRSAVSFERNADPPQWWSCLCGLCERNSDEMLGGAANAAGAG